MRIGAVLATILLLAPSAGSAEMTPHEKQLGSELFWDFTTCAVKREPTTAKRLLSSMEWGETEVRSAYYYAQRQNGCGNFGQLRFRADLFHDALAAAVFVEAHKGKSLPDYSSVTFPLPGSASSREMSDAQKGKWVFLLFANCVFRAKPDETRALLAARPYSDRELEQWQALDPVLGPCLPGAEGTKMTLRV